MMTVGKGYTSGGRCKPLDADRLRKKMPKVGDKLIREMEIGSCIGLGSPKRCQVTVTYVNEDHLWYEVEFPGGIRQGFKFCE